MLNQSKAPRLQPRNSAAMLFLLADPGPHMNPRVVTTQQGVTEPSPGCAQLRVTAPSVWGKVVGGRHASAPAPNQQSMSDWYQRMIWAALNSNLITPASRYHRGWEGGASLSP
eukprot:2480977-Rhodomonas_salina.1